MGVYLKWWILATFSVDYPRRNHYYLKKRINLGCNKHYNNRCNKYWIIISCKKILHNSKCVYLFYSCRFYLLPICKNKCELTGTSLVKKNTSTQNKSYQSSFESAILTIHDSVLSLYCQSSGYARGREADLFRKSPCFWDGLWFCPCLGWYSLFSSTIFYSPHQVYQHLLVFRLLLFVVDPNVF